jgi:hypothetical protein
MYFKNKIMEKNQIVEFLEPYFKDNKDLKSIILCDDGNVFYIEGKHYCAAHCKQNKVKSAIYTKDQFTELKKEIDKESEAKAKKEAEEKKKAKAEAEAKAKKEAEEKNDNKETPADNTNRK